MAAGIIRMARRKAGLSQRELAERAGQTQQSISAYETGRKDPTLTTLNRLLAAAGLEMRVRLEPIDTHDAALATHMESLGDAQRAVLEKAQRDRVAAARLRRVKGH